jgi:hypothetical protein
MSDEGGVEPSDGVRDAASCEVTPRAGKGALGIWRALGGPGRSAGMNRAIKDGPSPACKLESGGVYVCQHLSFLDARKAAGGYARVRTTLGKSDRVGS